ncbi:mtfA protein [Eubacteriaceae bacterium ES2]|nr:mtfA protein [Eubacteriaceae bacterium ES2]
MRADVKIGEKWLEGDFGFVFNDKNISPPEPDIVTLEIPGTSDVIDLTEAISGDVEYKQRKITIKILSGDGIDSYYAYHSKIANYIHGKKMKIVFNKDSGYYWIGRIAVSSANPEIYGSTITITATVDPYKYEVQSSMEPWVWDSFSFEDGIIRNYYNIAVPGSIAIIGRRKRVCPKIITTNVMTVSYLGNTYNLSLGENIIPDIFLGDGEHILTFSGSGTVSIDYRGGSL